MSLPSEPTCGGGDSDVALSIKLNDVAVVEFPISVATTDLAVLSSATSRPPLVISKFWFCAARASDWIVVEKNSHEPLPEVSKCIIGTRLPEREPPRVPAKTLSGEMKIFPALEPGIDVVTSTWEPYGVSAS